MTERAVRSRSGRVAWGTIAQGLSSASNFVVGLVVVRSVSLEDFGAFSVAYAIYLFCVGAFRAFGGRTFAIRFTGSDSAKQKDAQAALGGLALVAGALAGVLCIIAGAIMASGSLKALLLTLGVFLPFLLLQDAWRFSFVAMGRPAKAAANDGLWLAAQVVLFVVAFGSTEPGVALLLAAWAAAGTVAAGIGIAQVRRWPHPLQGLRFARDHGRIGAPLLGEHVVSQGANQVGILALAGLLPLASVGALRAGQLMLSPLNVLQQAAPLAGLPEAVHARAESHTLDRVVRSIVGALALASIALGAILMLIPDAWGTFVFGDGWQAGLEVLPALVVRNTAGAVTIGAFIGLQALERPGTTLRIGATRGVISLSATVVAGWLFGLQAAVWAMAAADVVAATLAAVAFHTANSTPSERASTTPIGAADGAAFT